MRLDALPNPNKVCHGDFVPSNFIVREDGSMCVCDWAPLPRARRGGTVHHIPAPHAGRRDRDAEKYLPTYASAWAAACYIQSWMSIVAAASGPWPLVVEQATCCPWSTGGLL
jgi:hypothetical protein